MKKNYILILLSVASFITGSRKATAQTDDNSLLFNGTTQIVTVPDDTAYHFGTNVFTVECWIKASDTQTNYPMAISKRLATSAFTGFGFGIDLSGKIWAQMDGSNYLPGLGPNLKDNTCHHIAMTRTKGNAGAADTVKFYVDGVFIANAPMSPTYTVTTAGPLYIGGDLANPGNNMYSGFVNEVRIWRYTRTAAQIAANKGTQIPGNTAGLVGYWRLNESSGQTVTDRSNLANNGVLGATTSSEATDPVWSSSCPITELTGIENYTIDNQISVYPNPVTDVLSVTGITGKTTVTVYDVIGKLILQKETEMNTSIDVNPLKEGIYVVVTENSKGRSFHKVIVQK